MGLCCYGCGKEALYTFKNGKQCCSQNMNGCAAIKLGRAEKTRLSHIRGRGKGQSILSTPCKLCGKLTSGSTGFCRACYPKSDRGRRANSEGLRRAYESGARPKAFGSINSMPYGMASAEWRSSNTDKYLAARSKQAASLKAGCASGRIVPYWQGKHLSEEHRLKLSKIMSVRLRDPEKRQNYGRGKQSHMEAYFEAFLQKHAIVGWQAEAHFWSPELEKNFFVDFLFEDLKLVVELDGTQHRLTVEKDSLRDDWFRKQGYSVRRIPFEEYAKGSWEAELLEILA